MSEAEDETVSHDNPRPPIGTQHQRVGWETPVGLDEAMTRSIEPGDGASLIAHAAVERLRRRGREPKEEPPERRDDEPLERDAAA